MDLGVYNIIHHVVPDGCIMYPSNALYFFMQWEKYLFSLMLEPSSCYNENLLQPTSNTFISFHTHIGISMFIVLSYVFCISFFF